MTSRNRVSCQRLWSSGRWCAATSSGLLGNAQGWSPSRVVRSAGADCSNPFAEGGLVGGPIVVPRLIALPVSVGGYKPILARLLLLLLFRCWRCERCLTGLERA